MTEYECNVSSCLRKAVAICMCQSPYFLACEVHAHYDKPQDKHKCQKIYSEISTSVERNLISLCLSYENEVDKSISFLTSACTSLLNKIKQNYKNILNELTEFKMKIIDVRKMNKKSQRISVLDNASEAEITISKFISNPSKIAYGWENYKLFDNEDQAKSAIFTNFNEENEQSKIMNIQCPHTKNLIKLDVIYRSITEVEILKTDNFPYASGWCRINSDLLLIHGGAKQFNTQTKNFTMSECTYLINTSFNTLAYVTKGPKKSDIGNGILYNGKVYFFGGFNKLSETKASVHKFVLSSKIWMDAADLPQSMGYCSSALAKSFIYVSGSPGTEIFQYNPDANLYVSFSDNLEESYKTIFFFNKKLFVIFDRKLMITDEDHNKVIHEIAIREMFMLGHSTVYQNSLYFILGMYNNKTGKYTSSKLCKIDGRTNMFSVIMNGVLCD